MSDSMIYVWGFLILFATFYKFFPPKKINWLYGYRTIQARKNQDVWKFANKTGGTCMLLCFLGGFFLTLIVCEITHYDSKKISTVFLLLAVILTAVFSEKKISKYFDSEGNRKLS